MAIAGQVIELLSSPQRAVEPMGPNVNAENTGSKRKTHPDEADTAKPKGGGEKRAKAGECYMRCVMCADRAQLRRSP